MATSHPTIDFPAQWLCTSDLSNTRSKRRTRPPIFAVSEITIWRWVKKGYLPEPVKIGGKAFWSAKDVAELVQQRARKHIAADAGCLSHDE